VNQPYTYPPDWVPRPSEARVGDKREGLVTLFREHVSSRIDAVPPDLHVSKWQKMARDSNVVPLTSLPHAMQLLAMISKVALQRCLGRCS